MTDKVRAFFLSLTIVAMLVFSAVGTTTVFADDGTATGSSETNTTTTDTDPGDTSATSEEQQPAEVPPPLLEQLPENTTVTVVDAAGETQPLASQDSEEAILLSDPIWCPEGQAPTPGANGCTASYSSFTELLDFLKANEGDAAYQQAGTIYVQQGAYLGGESSIDFNTYNFTNLNQHNLTVHGGWDTIDNSVDPTDTSTFQAPIMIGTSSNPWVGSLTFNNIFISNVSNQTGLTLYSQSDINLSNVEVTNSLNGANLNAGGNVTVNDSKFNKNKKTGANINSGGNVDVVNTSFNNNGSSSNAGKGLNVNSGGNVSLASVQANNNQVFGANVNAGGHVTVNNGFFSGNQAYTYNCKTKTVTGGYGLQVVTTNDISLDAVTASDNYFFGAHLEGSEVNVLNSFFNNNGSDSTSNPVGYGLEVEGTGAVVALTNVDANNNQLFGANIEADGTVVVLNSFFNGNKSYISTCKGKTYKGYGLKVVTTGAIVLDSVTATGNNLFGAQLEGTDIPISNSIFNNNGSGSSKDLAGKGLEVNSSGIVTLASVEANNNQLFGANVNAVGDVTINDSFFSGNKVYTYSCKGNKSVAGGGYGLQVITDGTITLNTVEASDNYNYGSHLDGSVVEVANGTFSNNGSGSDNNPATVGKGLEVVSAGEVTVSNVEANNNQLFGVDIQAVGKVAVANSFFSGNQSYVYTCQGEVFYGYGLKVVTTGIVALDGVTANENNLYGTSLDGLDMTIANSKFNNNVSDSYVFIDDTGLLVNSAGSVSLDNVEANENRLVGADIFATGDVTIANSLFSGNQGVTCLDRYCKNVVYHGYGLNVFTSANIYLDGVTANENNLYGASLEGAEVSVMNSTFNNNGTGTGNAPKGKGLEVVSGGKTTLTSVEANNNQLFGANIQAGDDVTVTNSFFNGNQSYTSSCKGSEDYGYGIKVVTTADILLNAVTASENRLFGAYVSGVNISVSDSSFNFNTSGSDKNPQGKGLEVISSGDTTLLYVEASYNQLFGTNIQAQGDVTVTGSLFAGNTYATLNGIGMKVSAQGDILLNADEDGYGVEAYDNGSTGVILEGWSNITVQDSSFLNNGASGLSIKSYNNDVTLTNVTATGNGLDGADVQAPCTNTVYVNGGTFANNAQYGIQVIDASLNMDGAQSFSNNPAGNVFNNRTTCFVSTSGNGNNSGHGNSNNNGYHGNSGGYSNGSNNGCGSYKKGNSYGR